MYVLGPVPVPFCLPAVMLCISAQHVCTYARMYVLIQLAHDRADCERLLLADEAKPNNDNDDSDDGDGADSQEAASLALYAISKTATDFSGRSLRKLPFLAFSLTSSVPNLPFDTFLNGLVGAITESAEGAADPHHSTRSADT